MPAMLKLSIGGATPVYRGQEHFWRIIRTLSQAAGTFTVSQVRGMTDEPTTAAIRAYVTRLALAGILEDTGDKAASPGRRAERIYRARQAPEDAPVVSRDGRIARPASAQQHMWNVMRGPLARSGFTAGDLVSFGSTDTVTIGLGSAKSYIQSLSRAGYLLQVDPGGPARQAIWRLKPSKNTGPKPPSVLRAKLVWDQNREKIAGEVIAEEVEP